MDDLAVQLTFWDAGYREIGMETGQMGKPMSHSAR
jgi:hypothetical protein